LGELILKFCEGNDGYKKEDLLKEMTGKTTLRGLSQDDALTAITAFESKYLSAGTSEREPGNDDN